MNIRLYIWQRGTAALLAPMVLVHLAVIFYATRQGLSAAEILGRTRGSLAWGSFYGAFVVAAAIHAAIGIGNILSEWTPMGDKTARGLSLLFGLFLFVVGMRAVFAVVSG
ncbi:MAG TPA: succinate dehydrogenase [Bradyrhizobium sp.]|jgi:fumarate reductase subunit C|nr:succinate dehydrogenase [Bradyrhizobium sp.]